MELANLSSNWKQLQKKLKTDKPTATSSSPLQTNSSKRKRSDLEPRRPSHPAPYKKPRRDEKIHNPQRKPRRHHHKKMNSTTTAPSNGEPPASTLTLTNAGLSPAVPAGKFLALDCEMVGIGPQTTPGQGASMLARASLVNYHGVQLYDSYVLPTEPVTDWRTHVSGITPAHMRVARPFKEVQRDVAGLLKDRVLVGHSVRHDMEVLGLSHPRRDIRDTARYAPYRKLAGGGSPRLRDLVAGLLGVSIQEGSHSSVEDARATMMLFRRDKDGFERENVRRWGADRRVRPADGEVTGKRQGGAEGEGQGGRIGGEVEEEQGQGAEEVDDGGDEGDGEVAGKKKVKKHKKKKKKK